MEPNKPFESSSSGASYDSDFDGYSTESSSYSREEDYYLLYYRGHWAWDFDNEDEYYSTSSEEDLDLNGLFYDC